MNNLYGIKCWVHIFSGSFGSFGSAVDVRTMNNLNGIKCRVHIFSGSFGSFGSAVDVRTMNNLYGIKCRVHIFSGSASVPRESRQGIDPKGHVLDPFCI